jgi:hypothetical protein
MENNGVVVQAVFTRMERQVWRRALQRIARVCHLIALPFNRTYVTGDVCTESKWYWQG